jgi:DNA-binding HxlR family transcriptional regulator
MQGKMCYTLLMKTTHHAQTTETPEACATTPMGRAIRLIGDVWVLLIIINLLRGPKRFNELRELMGHVSPKTLSQRLKELEEIQFVERRAFMEIPPRVEYHLTAKGQALGDVIGAIEQFAQQNLSDLTAPSLDTPTPHL